MDGNNSLKCIARAAKSDTQVFESDFYLSEEFVNKFADEVKPRAPPAKAPPSDTSTPAPTPASKEGDPCDGEMEDSPCADQWRAAAEENLKKMWGIFRETGIFTCVCHHRLVIWIADMIESSELFVYFSFHSYPFKVRSSTQHCRAKYPLAMVSMALLIIGYLLVLGYDIGCSFSSTISRSSLAQRFKELGAFCCVNAFHGYAHSYDCQRKFHPLVIQGMGLEDLEVMERVFSASNTVACLTRHASRYHRHLFIDMHFNQWNRDKYENLAIFIYNNYVQALETIETESVALDQVKRTLGVEDGNIEKWLKEEKEYLQSIKGREPLWDPHALAYVQLLEKLAEIE